MPFDKIDQLSSCVEKLGDNLNIGFEQSRNQNEKLIDQIKNVRKFISCIGRGLGHNFGMYNAQWLHKYLNMYHPQIQIEFY